MGSYYECSVYISTSVRPKDRERAEKCVLNATIPVLAEMGDSYTYEELAKKLESSECGEGENKRVDIYLCVDDLHYNPGWDIDADVKVQELAEQIAKKLNKLPLWDGSVCIPGYWYDRDPDISGYVRLPQEKNRVAPGQKKVGITP